MLTNSSKYYFDISVIVLLGNVLSQSVIIHYEIRNAKDLRFDINYVYCHHCDVASNMTMSCPTDFITDHFLFSLLAEGQI